MTDTTYPTATECPFGIGDPFEVIVPEDILTPHGNVQIPAGTYQAWQAEGGDHFKVYSADRHYAGIEWTSVMRWNAHRVGEDPTSVPEHDCAEHLRSTVVGDLIICGVCRREVEV